jgi:hypothetical protein
MGRRKIYAQRIIIPVREGTTALIDAAKRPGETRADFVRRAIERAVEREARAKLRGSKKS